MMKQILQVWSCVLRLKSDGLSTAILFCGVLFILSCQGFEGFESGTMIFDPSLSESSGTRQNQDVSVTLESLEFQTTALTLESGQIAKPNLFALLTNGSTFKNLGEFLITPYKKATHKVVWFSNDENIARVDVNGIITPISAGSTSVKASVGKLAATLDVTVKEKSIPQEIEPPQLESISIFQNYRHVSTTTPHQITLNARFTGGKIKRNLSAAEFETLTSCPVYFLSSNESVAFIDADGWLTPQANGSVTVMGTCENFYAELQLEIRGFTESGNATDDNLIPDSTFEPNNQENPVSESGDAEINENDHSTENTLLEPEVPLDPSDSFLNHNDTITLTVGEYGGYNSQNLPDIVLGVPDASRADVVSLGTNGEIRIELGGYLIVNGEGPDFMVFENPFSGWTERARVSVSEDGETFFDFECDAFDPNQVYQGCAGVTPVNYSNDPLEYLNPDTSGGDTYDLNDVGLDVVRFIKITDMATCLSPVLCNFGKAGFDLDAVAIVNGINL